jgi:hypothetical protein
LIFESTKEAEKFYGLLMRYWNGISGTFRSGEIRMPYRAEDEDGLAAIIRALAARERNSRNAAAR